MPRLLKLVIVLFVPALLIAPATVSFAQGEEEPPPTFVLTVTQNGQQHLIVPIEGSQDVVTFYNYDSDSTQNGLADDGVSMIYFYRCTTTGELSLVMHHSCDNSARDYHRVDFDLDGVPSGAYVAVSDDPDHTWNPDRPDGREFDLGLEPEGNWEHYHNSDGGVISGLPVDQSWYISINPNFIEGIDRWEFLTGSQTAMVQAAESIPLDMNEPLTTSQASSGGGGCFIATAAYGSSLDGHVDTLRTFRDQYLVSDGAGGSFVEAYYRFSPTVARFIDDHASFKPAVRAALLPAVATSTAKPAALEATEI